MKLNSVRVKIISLIFIGLLLIAAVSLFISVSIQRQNLLDATQRTLFTNTEILNGAIRNVMVKGEAPIAVDTMASLGQIQEFKELEIYRIDGSNAFNDYQTVDFVNRYQDKVIFTKTPRLQRTMIDNPFFRKVIESNSPVRTEDLEGQKSVQYFYPILNNDRRCQVCHGDPAAGTVSFIRGVAHFEISVAQTIDQIGATTRGLTLFFASICLVFSLILVLFMRGLIIRPLERIGNAVREIGLGHLEARAQVKNRDEFGDLAAKINDMIKGLNERFHLSKYVSRSTESLVASGGRGEEAIERKRITVLFSDIRGFTAYTEAQAPETVIGELNALLQAQAELVEKYGGDIDKFVGDELMAVFPDEWAAVRCAVELVKAVHALNRARRTGLFIGVGINAGEVIAGNIGSRNRMEYAVIGDTINLASRLCGLARPNTILISESVQESVKDRAATRLIPNQKIKGKAAAVNFYAVTSLKPDAAP